MIGVGSGGRGVAVVAGVVLTMLLGVGTAAAHVEITVEPARPGAPDATVTFTAAAESRTAGISALEVQVPEGIRSADVALVSAPSGWTLLETTDGYIVSGSPLPVGEPARYAITVKQLPNTPSVVFKTLQTYSDGAIDQWIELPTPGGTPPKYPAPMVTFAGTTGTPDSQGHAHPAAAPAAPAADSGVPVAAWIGVAILAAAVIAVGAVITRRRSGDKP
jgi:hypothetical protein